MTMFRQEYGIVQKGRRDGFVHNPLGKQALGNIQTINNLTAPTPFISELIPKKDEHFKNDLDICTVSQKTR